MAADLIQHSTIPHSFMHDLESVFWVLVWMAVSFIWGNWSTKVSSFLKETMSPRVYNLSSGRTKLFFMQSNNLIGYKVLDNMALLMLLSELRAVLSAWHQEPPPKPTCVNALLIRAELKKTAMVASAETLQLKKAEHEENNNYLKDHQVILKMIQNALNMPGWPSNDATNHQPLLMSDECWSSAWSSFKKALSVAQENGVFVLVLPCKQMKSA